MSPLSKFEMAFGLMALDMQELVDGGVIADRDYAAWDEFQADRVKWMLEHPMEAQALWFAIWRHIGGLPVSNVVDLDRERWRQR
jgi:hypothetical protein